MHLSYSKYRAFQDGQYVNRYIFGKPLDNIYVRFGKSIAERLEAGEDLGMEVPDEREKKVKCEFGGIPLIGFLDGFDNDFTIHEYKTTTRPWGQRKVDNDEQLTFYAIMISEALSVDMEDIKIKLWCLETFEDIDGQIKLTGDIYKKETNRTTTDKLKTFPKMEKAWEGIKELNKQYGQLH